MKKLTFLGICIFLTVTGFAQDIITLSAPHMDGGMPLMKALKNRQTSREFADKKLTDQQLADLLWAANGINRPESKKRTAPSAMNYQEVDIYVSTALGLYLYNAEKNSLTEILKEDIRAKTGIQEFVKNAGANLIFVADYSRMTKSDEKTKEAYAMADAAFISENVYLFCASEGLATGVRAYIDKEMLGKIMKLTPDQHIMLGQAVGFPKGK
ncbi:MAG: SagB/ThcOx family dehydrogenase [Bacteroidetes bacterium]|nr:SagB/ThcOx family dehydrogenase [Bacteroidota bacterium]